MHGWLQRASARSIGASRQATPVHCHSAALPAAVYTLVQFAGVTNYVAATGNAADHEACLDLNLPCWDASR